MKALLARVTFLFVMFAAGVQAQTNQGSIAGTVFDPSGAVVAGAKITALSTDTGARYEVASSDAGYFVFPHLNVGTYDVTVGAAGFKTATYKGVVVQVGTISALDAKLEAGAVTQIITVDADAPRLQTESSEIGTVVNPKELTDLPLPLGSVVQAMRSPEAFVFLTPGAVGPGTANGNGGTFESKINGGQNYATEVLLDGVSMFRSENGSSFDETAPSVDALSEFKVTTSTMPPEMGRTTGGVESFTTKARRSKREFLFQQLERPTPVIGSKERLWTDIWWAGVDSQTIQRQGQDAFLFRLGTVPPDTGSGENQHRPYNSGAWRGLFRSTWRSSDANRDRQRCPSHNSRAQSLRRDANVCRTDFRSDDHANENNTGPQ
ncbi:carboxypeptidase regulatory-like domain-containing protein [Candidatus Bathyarchaeota archaeon]|nr:MAG: carboxypeptidase regulatory-like domain-containing protein [Candidatus Bathyarchaeota archaeon]